jgi:hypothetical protein
LDVNDIVVLVEALGINVIPAFTRTRFRTRKPGYHTGKYQVDLSRAGLVTIETNTYTNCNVRYDGELQSLELSGNVHTLDLSWTEVTDVSALGRVHTLDLNNTKVTDVSALGGVYTLDID